MDAQRHTVTSKSFSHLPDYAAFPLPGPRWAFGAAVFPAAGYRWLVAVFFTIRLVVFRGW